MCRNISPLLDKGKVAIVWLSSNSIWIYLWHIMAFYLWEYTIGERIRNNTMMLSGFVIEASFMLIFSVIMTCIQLLAVSNMVPDESKIGRTVRALLT
jgi:hypothetical protein